ncbi:hypothetical protein [Nesterenkonia muleiensis]|uniref:hypothetical protein n=1 Tax=Nesterenkonia muleiensis TaxID=2282648 RepID=UPI00130041A9|nr:hypothetical protein [Nesterenkonia muleiensis]
MPNRKPRPHHLVSDPGSLSSPRGRDDLAAQLREDADNTGIPLSESAEMVPRPDTVATTYREEEWDRRAAEQTESFSAEAAEAARDSEVDAAGLLLPADTDRHVAAGQQQVADQAREAHMDTQKALQPFRTRSPKGKYFYGARMAALACGEVAAVSGAALMLGETPLNSYAIGGVAGVSAVILGMVGKSLAVQWRRQRRAAIYAEGELPESLHNYRELFTAPTTGQKTLTGVVGLAGFGFVCLAVAVYGLRSVVDGGTAGLLFAALALMLAAASVISGWMFGDDVADTLAIYEADYSRETKRLRRYAASRAVSSETTNHARAASIREEHAHQGEAARLVVEGAKYRLLARNPATAGHGPGREPLGRQRATHPTGAARPTGKVSGSAERRGGVRK